MKGFKRGISLTLTMLVAFSSVNMTGYAANIDETETVFEQDNAQPGENSQDELIYDGAENGSDSAESEDVIIDEEQASDADRPADEMVDDSLLLEENMDELPESELDQAGDFVMNDDILTGYIGAGGDIVIPDGVYEIAENAFKDNTTITSVVIPVGTKIIGACAFSGCSSLNKIEFNQTTKFSVNEDAFSGCAITEVSFADGLTKIPDYVLENAGFGTDAVVNIPDTVEEIGVQAFENEGAKTVARVHFQGNSTLKTIGKLAFSGCVSLSTFNMPETVTTIGTGAFSGCTSLTDIDVSDGVTAIEASTFENCTSVTSVNLPVALTKIGKRAFKNTGLTEIVIPSKVTSIANEAFANSPIATVELQSKSITTCEDDIFRGCRIASVTFPEGITNIPALFDEAGFVSGSVVTIPASAEKISKNAFVNATGLNDVVFEGEKLKEIGASAFEGCTNITAINLPNSVTTIGSAAFTNCTGLTSVIIPANANTLGNNIFEDCTGLTSVEFMPGTNKVGAGMFKNCSNLVDVKMPGSVLSIEKEAFYGCRSIVKLVVSDSITKIGDSAFYNCVKLEEISALENVTTIGASAFYKCINLSKISLGNKLTTIGHHAFSTCYGITEFTMPNSVSKIGENLFDDCKNMTKVSMSEGLTSLPSGTFADCLALRNVYLGSKISSISGNIFEGITIDVCDHLISVSRSKIVKSCNS